MMSEREEEALKKMPMKQFFIWMKKNRIFDELKKNTRVFPGGGQIDPTTCFLYCIEL